MAGECQILVVQRSSTWLSEYNLNSLGFLFSSKLMIMKESYVTIVFLIIFWSSFKRKFSKFSHYIRQLADAKFVLTLIHMCEGLARTTTFLRVSSSDKMIPLQISVSLTLRTCYITGHITGQWGKFKLKTLGWFWWKKPKKDF